MVKLIRTSDGSHTIYIPELDEHYHSIHGAIQESEFIFLKNGFDFCKADPLRIFEVGFGTGLNALLTALRSVDGNREVYYTSIEKYPLDANVISQLNYPELKGKKSADIFNLIHAAPWDRMNVICRNFNLLKINGDLITSPIEGMFDLIYFDAFGPDKQPGMWSSDTFHKISLAASISCIFITYSAKGDVKRNLRNCGFNVTLLPGPPGKRHIIRAIKR